MDPSCLCHYSYKTCYNVRDRKRNGDLHKLCAFHRFKANTSHRKHVLKRTSSFTPLPDLSPPTRPSDSLALEPLRFEDTPWPTVDLETIQVLLSL